MDSKSDKESKSSKDEEKSNASNDSAKIELFDELKNTIINQYQSIYFKDDNQIIHKKFENLNKLKFFLQLFFVILSPLVVIIYFATMHQTIHMVGDSANNINSNERLRKNFLRVTDAIVTLLLNDGGFYNSITLVDSSEVDQLMDHEINIIDSLYENILEMNKQDEWINVLYRYVPEKERQITVNYGGKFSAMTITMEQLIQKLINDFSAITLMNKEEFIRGNSLFTLFRTTSFHTFDQVLREVSLDFFTNAIDSFYSSRSAFLWFVLGNLLALVAGLALMYRLAFRVLKSLKQILFSFTLISFQTAKQTEEYYKQLMRLFTASTLQYIDGKHAKDLFKELSLQNAKPNPSELKFAKKNKRIIDKDFMKKNTTRIFSFFITGVLIYTILNVGLFLYINASISYSTNVLSDGKELVKLDTVYIASLIGLKLLFLDQALYEEVALPYLTQSLDLLNTTLSSTVFKGDCVFSDYAREILEGRVCEIFRPLFKTADQIENCGALAQGKLSTGLATFHSYYSNLVLFPLNLEGERFGEVNIDSIYEFGQLIQIIDEVIMNRGLDLWKTDVKDFLSTENRLMTIFVIVLCVFNMLMFLIVERTIVKNLHTRFLFYRKVYNRYMLTESLFKEKLIKAGLVKYQLVNR